MLIQRAQEINGTPVDMEGAQGVEMRMMVGREHGAPNFSMRHFTVAAGGHTPRHQHNYEHEVFIVGGVGQVEHDGRIADIRVGDVIFVEPNKVHQFVNKGAEPLTFLCMVPTAFDCASGEQAITPGS